MDDSKKLYTVGFIFTKDLSKVLLVHKTHPEWQAGKLNGPGGKIEESEDSFDCVVREIKEETDLTTSREDWILAGEIHSDTLRVDMLGMIYKGDPSDAKSLTEERVEWCPVDHLPDNIIPNLSWIILATLERLTGKLLETFSESLDK